MGTLGKTMSDGKESTEPSMESRKFSKRIAALAEYSKSKIQTGAIDLTARVRDFRAKSAIDAVLEAPDRFKREWAKAWCYRGNYKISNCNYCYFSYVDSIFCFSIRFP